MASTLPSPAPIDFSRSDVGPFQISVWSQRQPGMHNDLFAGDIQGDNERVQCPKCCNVFNTFIGMNTV